ncbi:SDR family oxidoreductase [bacterium]|nr:SDR family oxidoreductase [bacterium]
MNRRTIVLTGCTRGLGRSLLAEFAAGGDRVVGCGRSTSAIASLRTEYPGEHRFDSVDVSDADQVAHWAKSVLEQFGPPAWLINNAAVINRTQPLWQIDPAEFSRLMNINVTGSFLVARGFLPAMVEQKRGVIVNFSSGWGRSVDPDVAPYCASKWAIEGMTLALAKELPEGMAAVSLNPGVIDTDMLRSCMEEYAKTCHKPADWARVAAKTILSFSAKDNGMQHAISLGSTQRGE